MNTLLAVTSAASDAILLCAEILILSVIADKQCLKVRFAVIVASAAITGFISEMLFGIENENSSFALLVFDCIRLCLFALLALKSFALKDILAMIPIPALMTIQFLCSILSSAVKALLPQDVFSEVYYINYITMIAIPAGMLILAICFRIKTRNRTKIISGAASSIPVHTYICIFIAVFLEGGLIEGLSRSTAKFELQIRSVKILSLLLIICVTILIISLAENV